MSASAAPPIRRAILLSILLLLAPPWHGDAAGAALTLSWAGASSGETGFSVERSVGEAGPFVEVARTDAGATTFVDGSVSEGTLYCYRVRAFTAGAYSDYSNMACGLSGPSVSLVTQVAGSGTGAIISAPSGIVCEGHCSSLHASGAAVTLIALPGAGSTFTGWSGAGCRGAGSCMVSLGADAQVTATFDARPVTPGSPPGGDGPDGPGEPGCAPGCSSANLVAAVLPDVRAVQVGAAALAFVAIVNAGPATAPGVGISLRTAIPAEFVYQATDPDTNLPIRPPNTSVDIAPNEVQTFLISITPTDAFDLTSVALNLGGEGGFVEPRAGVNTLLLSASREPGSDIVAMSATLDGSGVVHLAPETGAGAFAVATTNLGLGGSITVSVDTGTTSLPTSAAVCQTDPSTGACISEVAPTVTTPIDTGATPTFAVFVQSPGPVPFDPAANRAYVRFTDADGVMRGGTSVALATSRAPGLP